MLSYAIMPTEKVQSDRVDNRCQWCIQRLWEQKLAISLVNTKVKQTCFLIRKLHYKLSNKRNAVTQFIFVYEFTGH